jgi:type I restriction enzyme M protein
LKENGYNFDLCGFPHIEEKILEPKELIARYTAKKEKLEYEINMVLAEIKKLLDIK